MLDCVLHVRDDASKLENKKHATVAQALMNKKVMKSMIRKLAEENLPDPNIDQLDGDSDDDIVQTVQV